MNIRFNKFRSVYRYILKKPIDFKIGIIIISIRKNIVLKSINSEAFSIFVLPIFKRPTIKPIKKFSFFFFKNNEIVGKCKENNCHNFK